MDTKAHWIIIMLFSTPSGIKTQRNWRFFPSPLSDNWPITPGTKWLKDPDMGTCLLGVIRDYVRPPIMFWLVKPIDHLNVSFWALPPGLEKSTITIELLWTRQLIMAMSAWSDNEQFRYCDRYILTVYFIVRPCFLLNDKTFRP